MGVYRRPDSPTWWMSLQVDGHRVRINTMVEDRQLAKELFSAWKAEVARTRWLGALPSDVDHTVGDMIVQYLKMVTPRKSLHSRRRDRAVFARFAMRWGTLLVRELNPLLIEEFLIERGAQVCFATVSKELGILKAAFRCAIRWQWIVQSPFIGIALNQEGSSRMRWLSNAEEARLLGNSQLWLRDIIAVGLDTRLRPGNLVALQCQWVQDDVARVIVPREHTKTKKHPITIPLTRRASDIIRGCLKHAHSPYLFMFNLRPALYL
jgi:integrase